MHAPLFGLHASARGRSTRTSFPIRDQPRRASRRPTRKALHSRATDARAWLALLGLTRAAGCSNFHPIEVGRVYRSAQPGAAVMQVWIDQCDIKTVLQLRGGKPDADHLGVVEREGVVVVRVPLSARVFPSRAQLVAIWDAFASAEYPMLIHCRAGADRTGLAAAIYVLQRTGDLERARAQLALWYGHTGDGTARLDRVFEMYGRWHGRMDFRRWATTLYRPPEAFKAREPEERAGPAKIAPSPPPQTTAQ
jgi:hypothetical protein